MKPADHEIEMESENWEYAIKNVTEKRHLMDVKTLKEVNLPSRCLSSMVLVQGVVRHLMPGLLLSCMVTVW